MQALRSPILVFCLWALVSLGQAYPLAQVYAPLFRAEACACQSAGQDCQHGCDLRKKPSRSNAFHQGHDHVLNKDGSQKTYYVARDCGASGGILGFVSAAGDFFLISRFVFSFSPEPSFDLELALDTYGIIFSSVEKPPPRMV